MKIVKKDVEGVGFAIHYDEVLKHLNEHGFSATQGTEVAKAPKKKVEKKPVKASSDIMKKMQDLKLMHDSELITDKEYAQKKQKLLGAM
ncbi:SHOCT domain-containing protein [Desulfogranum marinum]|uniref:SHOCT domain-containing protein n=1 Tax=Desulfogranum marinum TaxID=453220 RepID=UPI00196467D7|nr:SHOCT domain-containing protein [Desulfogranum marinum]MBM9514725.1 SHOCT domain-containing protein [Desulfogranum marinum]